MRARNGFGRIVDASDAGGALGSLVVATEVKIDALIVTCGSGFAFADVEGDAGLAALDDVAFDQGLTSLDLVAIDPGTVTGAQILDEPGAILFTHESAVFARDRGDLDRDTGA